MRIMAVVALLGGAALVASLADGFTADRDEPAQSELSHGAPSGARASTAAAPALTAGAAALSKADDGHFYAEAMATAERGRGARVRFLVDTGASTVALTAADAQRIGVDLDALRFSVPVRTANGETTGAHIALERLSVSGVELRDVDALVLRDGLSQSLLGMSFLGRLSRMEASGDALILRR